MNCRLKSSSQIKQLRRADRDPIIKAFSQLIRPVPVLRLALMSQLLSVSLFG